MGAAEYARSQHLSHGFQGREYHSPILTSSGTSLTAASTQEYSVQSRYPGLGSEMQRRPMSASRFIAQDEISRSASTSALQTGIPHYQYQRSQRHLPRHASPLTSTPQVQPNGQYAWPIGSVRSEAEEPYNNRGYRSAAGTPLNHHAGPDYSSVEQPEEGTLSSVGRIGYAQRRISDVVSQQTQRLHTQNPMYGPHWQRWSQQQQTTPSSSTSVDLSTQSLFSSYELSQQ